MKGQDFFFVRKNARYEKVSFAELIYVKAMRGYMQLVTEQQVYFVLVTISEMQRQLPKEQFCRTHRSYLVATKRIRSFDNFQIELEPAQGGIVYQPVLARVTQLPVGAHYRKKMRESFQLIVNRMGAKSEAFKDAKFRLEHSLDEE
jgi:DNA-binding LytR/AlgR family response regulator